MVSLFNIKNGSNNNATIEIKPVKQTKTISTYAVGLNYKKRREYLTRIFKDFHKQQSSSPYQILSAKDIREEAEFGECWAYDPVRIEVEFEHEKDNKADENAIAVIHEGVTVGYIDARRDTNKKVLEIIQNYPYEIYAEIQSGEYKTLDYNDSLSTREKQTNLYIVVTYELDHNK